MKNTKPPAKNGRPDKKILATIIERVVEAARPDRIIVFGSAAHGERGPNSDIDLHQSPLGGGEGHGSTPRRTSASLASRSTGILRGTPACQQLLPGNARTLGLNLRRRW